MKFKDSVYSETSIYAMVKSVLIPSLRPAFCKCVPSIFYNFFFCQHRAAFLKRIPVTNVDHPLDEKIPFKPAWVTIYIDFVNFWIRMLSFLLRRYGRKSYPYAKEFIYSMGRLYKYAAEVYNKNLSTTKRPFYITRPRFFVIHLLDPHLMCVPSLHVMVVIHTYTMFEKIAKAMGMGEELKEQIKEMKLGALTITQAILFVKQHSVNCIPAALYAMTRFNPELFPPAAAEDFVGKLFYADNNFADIPKSCKVHPAFAPAAKLPGKDIASIKKHILKLYYLYLEEGKGANDWKKPVLNFLKKI